jgi:MraZ protein
MGESGIKWCFFLYFYGNMAPFVGEYTCRLDAKGRMIFPAAFKKQIPVDTGDRFVIKRDVFEQCLVMYPMDEWERQNRIIRSKTNSFNREHQQFLRKYFHGTAEVKVDGSGRILIPRRLLDIAGIDNEVVMAGQFGKIEIWNSAAYDKASSFTDDFAVLAEKILGNSMNEPGND